IPINNNACFVFLPLFLPCVGTSAVFLVYICMLWYAASYQSSSDAGTGNYTNDPAKTNQEKGLSAARLDKLPKITGKELVMSNDCAVVRVKIKLEKFDMRRQLAPWDIPYKEYERRPEEGTSGKADSLSLEKIQTYLSKEIRLSSKAVYLDEIESEQYAIVVPGCNHGFHLECADTWLSKNPVCPVCRTKLEPDFFNPPENNPC
ncbi:E3 ubiquitin-protein ligase ATL23-like, partial [Nicotiana sylvestris]|uniref:E3 ubiquitin-protein ligase ATL23-like n=1 Tax=Nicotiana sylvestris TaxID=4096 RepID=UPI00388C5342